MAGTLRGPVHSQGPRLLLPACAYMMPRCSIPVSFFANQLSQDFIHPVVVNQQAG